MSGSFVGKRLSACSTRSIKSTTSSSSVFNGSGQRVSLLTRRFPTNPTFSQNQAYSSRHSWSTSENSLSKTRPSRYSTKFDGRLHSTAVESDIQAPIGEPVATEYTPPTETYDLENIDKLIDGVSPEQRAVLIRFLKMASAEKQIDLEIKLADMSVEDKNELKRILDELLRKQSPSSKNLRSYLKRYMEPMDASERKELKLPMDYGEYNLVEKFCPKSKSGNTRYWSFTAYRDKNRRMPRRIIVQSWTVLKKVMPEFMNEDVVGFDMEWDKQFMTGGKEIKRTCSLIQIAKEDLIVLFHVAMLPGKLTQGHFQNCDIFKEFIESERILKVGSAIKEDAKRIVSELGLEPRGFLDLSAMHRVVNLRPPSKTASMGLAKMCERYLGLPLQKDVSHNRWRKPLLIDSDLAHYAANDAYAGYRIYRVLDKRRQKAGLPIDVPPPYMPEELMALEAKKRAQTAQIEAKAIAKADNKAAKVLQAKATAQEKTIIDEGALEDEPKVAEVTSRVEGTVEKEIVEKGVGRKRTEKERKSTKTTVEKAEVQDLS